jgi:hypothetical protein
MSTNGDFECAFLDSFRARQKKISVVLPVFLKCYQRVA